MARIIKTKQRPWNGAKKSIRWLLICSATASKNGGCRPQAQGSKNNSKETATVLMWRPGLFLKVAVQAPVWQSRNIARALHALLQCSQVAAASSARQHAQTPAHSAFQWIWFGLETLIGGGEAWWSSSATHTHTAARPQK